VHQIFFPDPISTFANFSTKRIRRFQFNPTEEKVMAQQPTQIDAQEEERVPAMQQVLENPFLLLFLGVAMPTVIYIVWGVMEIVGIPLAK